MVTKAYGIIETTTTQTIIDEVVEQLGLLGYAVVDGGYDDARLAEFDAAFTAAWQAFAEASGGPDALREIDEHNTIRAAFHYDRRLLALALNPTVREIVRRCIGGYQTLSQQNGVINPPHGERYNQGAWHRDLPYQHNVFERPMAINTLFCIDDFSSENGATMVLPATHKSARFPSEAFIDRQALQVTAPRGSYILLDCMCYHTGASNPSARPRRGVNHVYTSPILRQQIDFPALLGPDPDLDGDVRRLLGYDVQTPRSVAEFLDMRRARLQQS
jgi:ectoine hydroxylase-related dioxygenase (phytanoyl-CoA dioxygenase family)